MNWPSVSIVIPSLNRGAFIERTLLSVFRQDYPGQLQVIVSDGGSSDGTVDVLKRYPAVEWWSARDRGFADAVNRGLVKAHGEIVAIQSTNDFYLRDAFRQTIAPLLADENLAIASGCDVQIQTDESAICSKLEDGEITPRSMLMRRAIPRHCAFFRRSIIDRVGGLRTNIIEGADIDFWYRALHFYRGQFIPIHTAANQINPATSAKTNDHWYRSMLMMVESCESDPSLSRIFKLSHADKRDLYARWEILQEQRAGRTASEIELIGRLMESEECTAETLDFLALHRLIPKTGDQESARRSSLGQHLPDFNWYLHEEAQQRAVA